MSVSVLTATYNRRKFLPLLIECYRRQDYPLAKCEWIIVDDGEDCVRDVFEGLDIPNVRYVRLESKVSIGTKRNMMNEMATGEYLVTMDDDDFYPPTRISVAVRALNCNRRVQLAGCSKIFMYYVDDGSVWFFEPIAQTHCTNGTMAVKKNYCINHSYADVEKAEEVTFLNGYSEPMIQMDTMKNILVICHGSNTVDKGKMRGTNMHIKPTKYKLSTFVKDAKIRAMIEAYKE
jgi:glycosyltransferase involved in cell wall biosynthesis